MTTIIGFVLVLSLSAIFASPRFDPSEPVGSNPNVVNSVRVELVDHFNEPIINKFFAQFFWNNQEFAVNVTNPPLFVYINGDWDPLDSRTFLERGLMYDLARNTSAFMFSLDYRFNAESFVAGSMTKLSLQFYSTEQGVQDIVNFLRYLKQIEYRSESKVILFGNSFGGNLAVWLRQQYPELVDGVWAVAAPLEAKYDADHFYAELGEVIRDIDESCFDIFKIGLDQVDELVDNGRTYEVTRILNLCQDISRDDGSYFVFYHRFSEFIASLVTNAARFLLEPICSGINVAGLSEIERLGLFMHGTQNDTCFDINYPSYIDELLNEYIMNRDRIALYQQCTELGGFKSMNSKENLFGDRLSANDIASLCTTVFGIEVEDVQNLVETFNASYGRPNSNVTNVYFTHGALNPWRFMGVQNDLNDQSPAVVIQDYGKLWELFSLSSTSGSDLDAARRTALDLINLWLS